MKQMGAGEPFRYPWLQVGHTESKSDSTLTLRNLNILLDLHATALSMALRGGSC